MKFLVNIANLFEVKSILSLACAGVFVFLSVTGQISVTESLLIITMVFQSFFGYQNSKNVTTKTNNK